MPYRQDDIVTRMPITRVELITISIVTIRSIWHTSAADFLRFGKFPLQEDRCISITQPRIVRILWNLVRRRKFWSGDRNVIKLRNSQIQGGGRTPYLKSFLAIFSALYCLIKMKFGARRHNRTHTKFWWRNYPISRIQHSGRPPFWKSLYLHISAMNRSNLTKFGKQTQILTQGTEKWQKTWHRAWLPAVYSEL